MVAFPPETPRCTTYSLQIGPVCARDPASARPKPSRMDFLPSSMTSPGISSYFVEATNLLTYSVKPRALGKSLPDARPALSTEPARKVDPSTPREVLPKSRLNKVHPLFQTLIPGCISSRETPGCQPCRTIRRDIAYRGVASVKFQLPFFLSGILELSSKTSRALRRPQ